MVPRTALIIRYAAGSSVVPMSGHSGGQCATSSTADALPSRCGDEAAGVLEFSGAPTWDGDAPRKSLERAARAQVTVGGFLIYPVDPSEDVLDDETLKFVSVVGAEVVATTNERAICRT